ncbi:alpha-amylase [Sinobaca sp. H24]|uniref:alpha-amylase n=1 Tax=Sinobaca sp. H24 TaxID=2923376 RepID=UPI00207AF236|nr:alpha-amylase [Sinobaca sp. H24]
MKKNHTMMQYFEWHLEADGAHWNRLKEMASMLKEKGIDSVWIPPAAKSETPDDNGYGVYDLYDLGEFDQKGSIPTKYGTKEELLEAIAACHENDVCVYADVVMNHKAAADEKETFEVVRVNEENRHEDIGEPFEMEGWTKFTFPGRGDTHSDFKWNHTHFNGTDYNATDDEEGIFRILGEDKAWNENVADEFGNYDFLMFANYDYNNPEVKEEMISWSQWFTDTLGVDGFRLDAIKHINYDFVKEFAEQAMEHGGEDFYIVGEFWLSDLKECQAFLDNVDYKIDLFDVSLHFNLHNASNAGADYDLREIFDDTLVQSHPMHAVTFVDNHDSQPEESLESWVEEPFKQSAYALILLREDGYPCVFYGDYFGINGPAPEEGKAEEIDPLLYVRKNKAYGEQEDYFAEANLIGWVRRGIEEMKGSGCAVVISNEGDNSLTMNVGEEHAGEAWVDYTRNCKDEIIIEEDGTASFPVMGESVSVWATPDE